ncbi:MAG: hypothetical protein V3S48_07935 [Candidatus Neomarinimicrobiota bacterium]
MKFNKFKILTLIVTSFVLFSACEDDDKDKGPALGDIVGEWQLVGLTGDYTRTIAYLPDWPSDTTIDLTASWNYAAAILGAYAAAADQTLSSWSDDGVAPGFPIAASFSESELIASGIDMVGTFFDAASAEDAGTYTVNGTYPTIRTNLTTCATAFTIPQISDQGDYEITYDINNVGSLTLAGDVNLGDQVLPPFDDGEVIFHEEDGEIHEMEINFLDRDAHDEDYAEIQTSWSEDDDRVIMGVNEAYIVDGAFAASGEAMGDSAYIMSPTLVPWSGYLTWYAFNIGAEISVKVVAVKNPLTDLSGDGSIDATDMIIYMHADNLASAGGATAFGMPYALLVNSTNPAAPVPVDDSGHDVDISGGATTLAAGGKMTYIINPVCFPINELIDFKSTWEAVHDDDH